MIKGLRWDVPQHRTLPPCANTGQILVILVSSRPQKLINTLRQAGDGVSFLAWSVLGAPAGCFNWSPGTEQSLPRPTYQTRRRSAIFPRTAESWHSLLENPRERKGA